jgi:hypothetical protein
LCGLANRCGSCLGGERDGVGVEQQLRLPVGGHLGLGVGQRVAAALQATDFGLQCDLQRPR